MCKSWCELILGVIIIILAFWADISNAIAKWGIIIVAVLLIIHSFTCKKCFTGMGMRGMDMSKGAMSRKRI